MGTATAPDDPGIRPWAPRQPVEAKRLNALQGAVVTDILVGPGLRIGRKGNQVVISLIDPKQRIVPVFHTVKITTNLYPGVYNAKRFTGPVAPGAGAITEVAFGTLAEADDAIVWEPEGVDLATALPLTDLVTRGEVVATYSDGTTTKPIVMIPPPGVRDMRFKASTLMLQVAYVSNPTEAHWVDKVQFVDCA